MRKSVYLGLDAHTHSCVLVAMDSSGHVASTKESSTSEAGLIHHIHEIAAHEKYLAVEESSLAGWISRALRSHVTDLVVCDPRQNALISRSGNKNDVEDAHKLCRLLRMGELRPVYHSDVSHRFATKQRLWRYCRLGVVKRSSAGKPLAYKRLDRSGRGPLKAVSHQCFVSALRTK